jgi:hypothetical protein
MAFYPFELVTTTSSSFLQSPDTPKDGDQDSLGSATMALVTFALPPEPDHLPLS